MRKASQSMIEEPNQSIKYIPVKELILWSENPRDPIPSRSKNESIIRQALEDKNGKWQIAKLAKGMGSRYDYSELPTVVYENGLPIVYDGNRRVIIAMLNLGLYSEFVREFKMPDCPRELPCNVTSKQIALESIWRKHANTGSWDQISRDIFAHQFWKKEKSVFLQVDEILNGSISLNSSLNQRFVGEEVLINPRLKDIGIKVESGSILSRHDADNTMKLLNGVFNLIVEKKLSTRNNRSAPLSQLVAPELQSIISNDKEIEYHKVEVGVPHSIADVNSKIDNTRLPRRVKSNQIPIFGKKLGLSSGEPANLYRDIISLYDYYEKNKKTLSDRFPALIRMALRLECELVARCANSKGVEALVKGGYDKAKEMLSQSELTLLHTNNVSKDNMISLLHTGAHNYESSYDISQTIAMSLIVAGLLQIYCAKKEK